MQKILNKISDLITNILIKHNKLNSVGTSEWSDFDYKLRCSLFNYGSLFVILLFNILFHSWIEIIIIISIFNVIRVFAEGIHAIRLDYCFFFSTIYFTILANISKFIIYNENNYLYYIVPIISIIWSVYNYKYIPKININEKLMNINNNKIFNNNTDDSTQELTELEKQKAYKYSIFILTIIIIASLFLCKNIFLSMNISIGLCSVNLILSNIGEKIFNCIQKYYIHILNKINKNQGRK